MLLLLGCRQTRPRSDDSVIPAASLAIEQPAIQLCSVSEAHGTLPPRALAQGPPTEFQDLTLEEVLQIALANSRVLRDLGGRVLQTPASVSSVFDPAIRETDPRFGVEAALSEFDANLSAQTFFQKNDRAFNNATLAGGATEVQQGLATFDVNLSKTAATGTQVFARAFHSHDNSTAPGNLFPHAWEGFFETGIRQPLLQGAGVEFNRIAGPSAQPGLFGTNGVLIARINTDISLADFELGVRNLVHDLITAYWELYFAYRDLDAKQLARDSSYETWKLVKAKALQGGRGGEANREAFAEEQYFFYQDLVEETLNGSRDSSGGLYRSERTLRRLMGLSANDGLFIRPADEPFDAPISYHWDDALQEALASRVELRKQGWSVKQRELQLIAAKNFTLPRLDLISRYRVRGLGDDFAGDGSRFASMYQSLGAVDHEDWEFGVEFNVPIGRRRGHAAVRNAELQLCREREILREQELQVSHDLSDAVGQVDQAWASMGTRYNRMMAALRRVDSSRTAYDADQLPLDQLLEAQQRLYDAQSRYYRARINYVLAVRDVSLQKGELLSNNGIELAERASCVRRKNRERVQRKYRRQGHLNYSCPGIISRGVEIRQPSVAEGEWPAVTPAESAGAEQRFGESDH